MTDNRVITFGLCMISDLKIMISCLTLSNNSFILQTKWTVLIKIKTDKFWNIIEIHRLKKNCDMYFVGSKNESLCVGSQPMRIKGYSAMNNIIYYYSDYS